MQSRLVSIYCVRPGSETDVEPRAGWYAWIAQGQDEDTHGPFATREDAEIAIENAWENVDA